MDEPLVQEPGRLLYRRLLPIHWHSKDGRLKPAAFLPRDGERGLSFFLADKVDSPRSLYEDHASKKKAKLDDPAASPEVRAKIQRMLDEGKLTPEALYKDGWRVASLAIDYVPLHIFHFDPPDGEADGHVNLVGEVEAFQIYSLEWVTYAVILPRDQALNL